MCRAFGPKSELYSNANFALGLVGARPRRRTESSRSSVLVINDPGLAARLDGKSFLRLLYPGSREVGLEGELCGRL